MSVGRVLNSHGKGNVSEPGQFMFIVTGEQVARYLQQTSEPKLWYSGKCLC